MVLAATHLPAAHAALLGEVADFTLTDALLAFGYTHKPGGFQCRAILAGDREVFRGNCTETWTWLRSVLAVRS
jgi:hypothetical protein